ncbi:uncharacterized protein [Prorops nasuta]|uniref:uncharacterized protein n=1 Tax=Prorops nasuta TaxID=863751 RepID=UPI0034CF7A5E
MYHQNCNISDEFEPRTIPKPVAKLNCISAPSVPEVSLIFENSAENNNKKCASLNSSGGDKCISYASWKERNYAPIDASVKITDSLQTSSYHQKTISRNTPSPKPRENFYPRKSTERGCDSPRQYDQLYARQGNDCVTQNKLYMQKLEKSSGESKSVKSPSPRIQFPEKHVRNEKVTSIGVNKNAYLQDPSNYNSQQMCLQETNPPTPFINTYNQMTPPGNPYPYQNPDIYSYPPVCPPRYYIPNPNQENNETVKHLLQVITSQNDQIKMLQGQLDRLLKMQEETLKYRAKCTCNMQNLESDRFIDNAITNNAVISTENVSRNIVEKKKISDLHEKETIPNYYVPKEIENNCEKSVEQTRKTLLEQKVSIGVMTSFEFTVQNSQFLQPDDIPEAIVEKSIETSNIRNMYDAENYRRNKTSFARNNSAQLENIVEDSESHLSSSQQQSSNFANSVRDLPEKQYYNETDRPLEALDTYCDYRSGQSKEILKNPDKRILMPKSSEQTTENFTDTKHYVNTDVSKNKRSAEIEIPIDNLKMTKDIQSSNLESRPFDEESIFLNSNDLRVEERPTTPEPSIHVDMQEYYSDDESDPLKKTSKIGWTFYNNVLGQVNEILEKSNNMEPEEKGPMDKILESNSFENKRMMETVKAATLEQLKKLGISLNDERRDFKNKKSGFDSSIYPRLDCQTNVINTTSGITETNTSMHMKALALKYLSDEQLTEIAAQKQGSMQHLMLSNVQGPNLSLATMRYLERYQLLPGRNHHNYTDANPNYEAAVPLKPDVKEIQNHKYPSMQSARTSPKVLDITTLKQLPKLL